MRRGRTAAVALTTAVALAFLAGAPSSAFVLGGSEVNGRLVPRHWPPQRLPLMFKQNDRPLWLLPNLAADSALTTAINSAMQTWSAVTGFPIRVDGTVATVNGARDGVNLLTFADTPQNRDLTADTLAVSHSWWLVETGEVVEADTVMNPAVSWATDGRAGVYDIQQILTHELGHVLGLDHSPIAAATMFPFSSEGETVRRTLGPDDVAGVRVLYSIDPSPDQGDIAGRVVTTSSAPVYGAHVLATDADGIARVGALTAHDGSFSLPSLPAGDYQVYAEPLDGPMTPDDFGGPFRNAGPEFQTTFAGGSAPATVHVDAGAVTTLDPIRVAARPPALNLQFVGILTADPNVALTGGPIALRPGGAATIVVTGEGLAAVPVTGYRFSGSDVRVGSGVRKSPDGSAAILPIAVRPGSTPGARNLYVAGTSERAALSGVLEVSAP
jgi:Matrixin/Carboxypeptidase regulatory-like domain